MHVAEDRHGSGFGGANLGGELRPGRLASGHLNDGAPKRPDICCATMACLLYDLWRHPVGCAFDALCTTTICMEPASAHRLSSSIKGAGFKLKGSVKR